MFVSKVGLAHIVESVILVILVLIVVIARNVFTEIVQIIRVCAMKDGMAFCAISAITGHILRVVFTENVKVVNVPVKKVGLVLDVWDVPMIMTIQIAIAMTSAEHMGCV